MNKRELFNKSIASLLIAAMVNPAMMTPAFARDSDIYLASTTGTSTAEPNVLFILGTNDRMNVAEAWREYDPLVYDSHAEYLWNDINIINNGAEQTTENAGKISTAAPPVNPFSPWGTWSGALNTDRQALWMATKAYANGTHTTASGPDPGARSTYRNYWLGSWYYWLPTGTATDDPRLRSVTFNRFLGFVQTVAGARGGVTFPATTANYTGSNDFRSSNACTTSFTQLEPSTIFAPTLRAQNAGFMLNQQWVRYEQYLGLQSVNNPALNYPGNNTNTSNTSSAPSVATFIKGYVDGVSSGAPTNTATTEPTNAYRDSANASGTPAGTGIQGQPIRRQKAAAYGPPAAVATAGNTAPDGVRSYAGWTDPKADMGGYVFHSWTATSTAGYYYPQTVLASVRGVYGYSLGANGLAAVPGGSLANEQFSAWLGNRDGAPTFGNEVGTPGYYDTTAGLTQNATVSGVANSGGKFRLTVNFNFPTGSRVVVSGVVGGGATAANGTWTVTNIDATHIDLQGSTYAAGYTSGGVVYASCDPAVGPGVANKCIQFASGASTYQIQQDCTAGGVVRQERDASTTVRYSGGTCAVNGAARCYVNGVLQGALATCTGAPANLTVPACSLVTNNTFYSQYRQTACSYSGFTTVNVGTCAWNAARQTVLIEGSSYPAQGTHYYGGACVENGATTHCTSGGVSKVLNGVLQPNVMGGYASPPPAGGPGTTLGCTNTLAAGNYNYGGTCGGGVAWKVNPPANPIVGVPAAPGARVGQTAPVCAAASGGTTVTIRTNPSRTYNPTCNNNYADSISCTAWYGSQCLTSPTPATYCPPTRSNSVAAGATGQWYQAYLMQAAGPTGFVHECLADNGTGNNPTNGYPTSFMRTFAQAYSAAATPNASVSASSGLTAAYSTDPAQGVVADAAKNIDVYSTNYLNFLYGAKACRDSAGALITTSPVSTPPAGATCSPIARKTRLAVAKDALSGLVNTTDGVRLGLMVLNKTDTTTASEGGNIAFAIRRMGSGSSDPAYSNRAALVTAIQGVVASSRTPLTESLYEAYRYFSGRTPVFGTLATTAAVGGVVSAARETTMGTNTDPVDVYGNVYVTNAGGFYNSPMMNNPNVAGPANCQKNYIVMITNGQPEEDSSANAAIKTMAYAAATGATVAPRTDFDTAGATPNNAGAPDYRQIPTVAGGNPYGPTDTAGTTNDGGYVWLDELTYFLSQADVSPGGANFQSEYSNCASPSGTHVCTGPTTTDQITGRQSIITYTIGFAGISAPVVQNAAVVSGGVYYVAQNAQQLQAALVAAFIAIRNWNPTAAAATVPISSLNRGESSHDVYLAFFGPSIASVWPGTVKKYQISTLASDCGAGIPLCLIGQTQINGLYNIQVIDPVTGQSVVDPTATSGPNDLNHPPNTAWYASTIQDGALPTRGGTGHVLVNTTLPDLTQYTPDKRKIYTFLTDSVPLFTTGTKSTTTDLTDVTNSVDFINNGNNITRCRLGDSGACNSASTFSLAYKEELISFARGGDLSDAYCTDGGGTVCSTWATWPHAAVEHSKPVIVNYDVTTAPPVQYMYYVQNNGMLTAVDTATGQEKWSFMIEEALPKLQLLRAATNGPEIYVADGSPVVFYDDLNGDGVINPGLGERVWLYFGLRRGGRAYYALDITQKDTPFFKWKITADQPSLVGNINSGSNHFHVGWTANIAVGMSVRVPGAGASGADLFATVTAINGAEDRFTLSANAGTTVANGTIEVVGTPLPAKVCNASSTCGPVAWYNELGQTWSTPNIVKLKALFGVANNPPALIFGGGYDPAEDTVPPGARTMGRAMFVVNGDNASTNDGVLKSYGVGQNNVGGDYLTADTLSTYSVPSDVAAINTDFDANNYIDRLYVGDLGGNVWRFDVDSTTASNWKGLHLADLSNALGEKRKFFFPPAIAPQDHPFSFHGVYIGSGDKEHPLLTGSTTPATTDDLMFMLMDDPRLNSGGGTPDSTGPSHLTTPITLATLVDIANIATTGADATTTAVTSNSLSGRQGWFRRLDNGEKVVNAPTVFRLQSQVSRLRFGTYAPLTQLNACTPPGEGRLNEIDSLTGDLLPINGAGPGPQRWYTGFLSRGYMSSTQLLILPSGGAGSTKIIYQFNCADANCQGSQIGQLGAPTKIYWYLEPEQ